VRLRSKTSVVDQPLGEVAALVISNETSALKFSCHAYASVSTYGGDDRHSFDAGTSFEQILDVSFDRKLRLFLDAIE